MDRASFEKKLLELKKKQAMIDNAWKKTGNRELLKFFVEIMPKVIQAERVSIFIHDPVGSTMWIQSGTGVEERQIEVAEAGSTVGKVIKTGKPIFEHDMQKNMGAHDTVAIKTGYVTYNTLCVPVKGASTGKITGVIQAINKLQAKQFDNNDLAILEKLAFHIQMHIENIYQRQEMAKISTQMTKQIMTLEKKLRGG